MSSTHAVLTKLVPTLTTPQCSVDFDGTMLLLLITPVSSTFWTASVNLLMKLDYYSWQGQRTCFRNILQSLLTNFACPEKLIEAIDKR